MNNALKKIQTIAKRLRKENPRLKYQDAIKKASIEYKKMGAAPKKKSSSKLPVKKNVTTVTKEKIGSSKFVTSIKWNDSSNALNEIEKEQVKWRRLEIELRMLQKVDKRKLTVSEKNQLSKEIANKKLYISLTKKNISNLKKLIK